MKIDLVEDTIAQVKETTEFAPLPDMPPNHPIATTSQDIDAGAPNQEAPSEEIRRRAEQINLGDTAAITSFGNATQSGLSTISQQMLGGVRNKDVGPAGDALRDIVSTIRGFTVEKGDTREKRSLWERITGKAAPMARFLSRFETVQGQIDTITDNLLQHEHVLKKDVTMLDKLYEKTLEFYQDLGICIAAGELKIQDVDANEVPALEAALQAANETEAPLRAQELRDLRSARDNLERRVHDLKLTRQVTMQALPSMRLIQENDKSLIQKIGSTLVNTVPLWETQLAQAITIQRSVEASEAVKDANDLTNALLTANAANLRQANASVRREMERGVFDIEAVKQANADLVATIEESLSIADEGKRKRAEAEVELQRMEGELKTTLARAAGKS